MIHSWKLSLCRSDCFRFRYYNSRFYRNCIWTVHIVLHSSCYVQMSVVIYNKLLAFVSLSTATDCPLVDMLAFSGRLQSQKEWQQLKAGRQAGKRVTAGWHGDCSVSAYSREHGARLRARRRLFPFPFSAPSAHTPPRRSLSYRYHPMSCYVKLKCLTAAG